MPSEVGAGVHSYLASAIAGRHLPVRETPGQEPLAFCDGRTILLPRASLSQQHVRMAVVAQALLVANGSLSAPVLRRLIGRPQAARRYAYLEVRRALMRHADYVPHAFSRDPALNLNLDLPDGPPNMADTSAHYALDVRIGLPDIPDFIGSVRPLATLRILLGSEGLGALAKKRPAQLDRADDTPRSTADDNAEESKILKLFQNPLIGKTPLSNILDKLLNIGASRGDHQPKAEDAGGMELPVSRMNRAWQRGVHAVRAVTAFPLPDFDTRALSPQFRYPEWDDAGKRYRQDWVHVDEIDPWRAEGPRDLRRVLTPLPRELQRQLAALGLHYEMHRRQRDGAEFDAGRLIETAIEIRAGHSPAAMDIYRSSRKTGRGLGVMVVLDLSGSTEDRNARGESVFEHQLRAAWHLTQALDGLGDRVALYGYQSWGRKLVRMVRLKGHDERWSGHVAERFGLVEPAGYTRTGAAIRHADQILRKSMRLSNRLMILITDGLSYDQDYEAHYAEADTRQAMAEARAGGTACVCLCIGGHISAKNLNAIFGMSNLLMVDDAAQLTGQIRKVATDALRQVLKRPLGCR